MESRRLGHLALYHIPGKQEPARRLLSDLGFTVVENGPPGFASVLLDEQTANHHDNLVYLAEMAPQLWELEQELRELRQSSEAAKIYDGLVDQWPEIGPHFGVKFQKLEDLEDALQKLDADLVDDGPLHGHATLRKFRARPGLDDAVDARMESSPAFTGDEKGAFGDHIVQCFVRTDMFGTMSSAATIELDYAFDRFYEKVPTY